MAKTVTVYITLDQWSGLCSFSRYLCLEFGLPLAMLAGFYSGMKVDSRFVTGRRNIGHDLSCSWLIIGAAECVSYLVPKFR